MSQLAAGYDYLLPDFRPKLRSGVLVERVGTESIAWGPQSNSPVYLDNVATVICGIFDGEATSADLAEDLCDVFGLERDLAEAQVRRVVSLAANGELLDQEGAKGDEWRVFRALLPEPNW